MYRMAKARIACTGPASSPVALCGWGAGDGYSCVFSAWVSCGDEGRGRSFVPNGLQPPSVADASTVAAHVRTANPGRPSIPTARPDDGGRIRLSYAPMDA